MVMVLRRKSDNGADDYYGVRKGAIKCLFELVSETLNLS